MAEGGGSYECVTVNDQILSSDAQTSVPPGGGLRLVPGRAVWPSQIGRGMSKQITFN